MSTPDATPRRTQQERRDETITRLLDAAAETVYDLGYARTTVAEICVRAELSQGALYRHFPTRKAILVATAERAAEQQVDEFSERFADIEPTPASLTDALRHLRVQVRSRTNQVWHELIRAARTDDELRVELAAVLRDFHRTTGVAAQAFAGDFFEDPRDFRDALRIIINYLDGEAAVAEVSPDEARDEASLQMLTRLLLTLARTDPLPE